MNPQRLLEACEDDFELALLKSSRLDVPRPGGAEKLALSLGVSTAALTAAAAAQAAATSSATASAAPLVAGSAATSTALGSTTVAKATFAGVVKWLGMGALAGAVATGTAQVATEQLQEPEPALQRSDATTRAPRVAPRDPRAPRAPASTVARDEALSPDVATAEATAPRSAASERFAEPTTATPQRQPHGTPRASAGIAPEPVQPIAPLPEGRASFALEPAPASHPKRDEASAPSRAPSATPSLRAELALLERARAALIARNAGQALSLIDDYQRTRTSGVLDFEAQLIRVESLLLAGRVHEARALAEQLLARNPNGASAARLRAITGR